MNATGAGRPTLAERGAPARRGAIVGFLLGLFGHLGALVAFGYVGLFVGGADAGEQLAVGIYLAWVVALVASVITGVAALRTRRSQPRMAAGLGAGMAVGVALIVLLSIRIFGLMNDLGSGCPCEPIVDQVRWPHD